MADSTNPSTPAPLTPFTARRLTRTRTALTVQMAHAVDATASSEAFAAGIRDGLASLLRRIEAGVSDLRVWLQTHGDLDENEPTVMLTDGEDPATAMADAGRIVFAGGGDPHETHLDALEQLLLAVPWDPRPDVRRVLVAWLSSETKPARSGHAPEEIGAAIRSANVLFYLMAPPTPPLWALARAAQGLLIPISNDPNRNEWTLVVNAVTASLHVSLQTGATTPMPPQP